jgi:hypothetical protein
MTSNRWKMWKEQEPPADFVDRTVAALMTERRRPPSLGTWRRAAVAAAAAVLIAGGAFGLGGASLRASRRIAPATIGLPTSGPLLIIDPPRSQPALRAAPSETTQPAHSSVPVPPRRKLEAPATGAADAGRKVVLPRCYCSPNEAICDCF